MTLKHAMVLVVGSNPCPAKNKMELKSYKLSYRKSKIKKSGKLSISSPKNEHKTGSKIVCKKTFAFELYLLSPMKEESNTNK